MGDRSNQGEYGDVLSNRRRRLVLDQLQSHGSMTLRDLAEQIAVIDQQTELESLCEEAVEEVEVALHHVHAPKLAEADYVKYDARQKLVGLTDRGRQLRVEVECDGARIESSDGIAVELCLETVGDLHDLIQQDDRFDVRMSYDEVINTVLADSLSTAREAESEEQAR